MSEQKKTWTDNYKEAIQRHHDYFVQLEKDGNLADEDRPQLELALQREKLGEVKMLNVKISDNARVMCRSCHFRSSDNTCSRTYITPEEQEKRASGGKCNSAAIRGFLLAPPYHKSAVVFGYMMFDRELGCWYFQGADTGEESLNDIDDNEWPT